MRLNNLLAFASLNAVSFAAPKPIPQVATSLQSNIQTAQTLVQTIINELGQQRSAVTDFSALQAGLAPLVGFACPPALPLSTASSSDHAIQYLQDIQAELNLAVLAIRGGDTLRARTTVCLVLNYVTAAGAFIIPSTPTSSSAPTTAPGPGDCASQEDRCRTAPDANQSFCSVQAGSCESVCANNFYSCSTAPDANHSYCASAYSGCLGYYPFTTASSTATIVMRSISTSTASPVQTDCANDFYTCSTAPHANHAYCASAYAGCLGYNPFTTASSTATMVPRSTSAPVASPVPTDCTSQVNSCQDAPFANNAVCASLAAQCQATCRSAYDSCATVPDANHSYCAYEYSNCLGYNPFAATASSTTTTASPATSTSASITPRAPTDCTSQKASCLSAPGADPANCESAYTACQTTCTNNVESCNEVPNVNRSYCTSVYAGCLGYNSFAAASSTTKTASSPPTSTSS